MSPEAMFYNGVWRLPAASKNDAAEYKCVARNNVGVNEKTTILYVQGMMEKFMFLCISDVTISMGFKLFYLILINTDLCLPKNSMLYNYKQ
jgi:hypothetical protein